MKVVLPKSVLNFVAKVHLSRRPLWITYNPILHKLKGHEIRRILDVLQKGDILLRRWDGYLNTILTPGFWAHAGLYAGGDQAIHALGDGVIKEDILNFCRADSLAVMRVKGGDPDAAIRRAHEVLGKPYDYEFEGNDDQYYCTELCDVCYGALFADDYTTVAGNSVLTPDGLRNSPKLDLVLETRH